jgi:hypothetical protein
MCGYGRRTGQDGAGRGRTRRDEGRRDATRAWAWDEGERRRWIGCRGAAGAVLEDVVGWGGLVGWRLQVRRAPRQQQVGRYLDT